MQLLAPENLGSEESRNRLDALQAEREQYRQEASQQIGKAVLNARELHELPLTMTKGSTETGPLSPRIEIPIETSPEAAQEIVVRRNTPE